MLKYMHVYVCVCVWQKELTCLLTCSLALLERPSSKQHYYRFRCSWWWRIVTIPTKCAFTGINERLISQLSSNNEYKIFGGARKGIKKRKKIGISFLLFVLG